MESMASKNLRPRSLDRSSHLDANRRVRVSNRCTQTAAHWEKLESFYIWGGKRILKVCVDLFVFLMQPEGAESDDPEGAPEKKPSGPSISVSRPSVSSGILIFVPAQRGDVNPATVSQLHSSHTSILIIHKLSKQVTLSRTSPLRVDAKALVSTSTQTVAHKR